MTADEIVADARSLLNEPAGIGHASNHEIMKFANRGQDLLASSIAASDVNFFEESDTSLGFVADQEEYDIPEVARDRIITRVERTDLSDPMTIDYIRFQMKQQFQASSLFSNSGNREGRYYYLRGNRMGLKPTPTSTIANNVKLFYVALPHELHHGVMGTPGDTTSFVMPTSTSSASNPHLKAGRLSTTPDYYVNARIRMLTGTDRGLERKITAFNVATKTATVDSAWTIANVQDQEYVILSPLRNEYVVACSWYAVLCMAVRKKNDELKAHAEIEWGRVYNELLETAKNRHFDENVHVEPPIDFDE